MLEKNRKLLGYAGLVGLSLSLVVHVLALMGSELVLAIPGVMLLHVGMFGVFVPFVLAMQPYQTKIKKSRAGWLSVFPMWLRGVILILPTYVALNFFTFMSQTRGGSPSQKGSGYVLQNRGTFIRKITKQEYNALRVNEVRGFSGHWLLFYGVPTLFFLFVPPFKKEEESEEFEK